MFINSIPNWLLECFRIALLGEIYPNIRAIAVGYNESGDLLIRYYLDREPTDFDTESAEIVATNLETTMTEAHLNKIDIECLYTLELQRDLPPLSGFVYARREVP